MKPVVLSFALLLLLSSFIFVSSHGNHGSHEDHEQQESSEVGSNPEINIEQNDAAASPTSEGENNERLFRKKRKN